MNKEKNSWWKGKQVYLWFLLFPAVIFLWFYYEGHMLTGLPETEVAKLGPGARGDMYGGLNTLFTGLAFAGLIVALIFQMKEFRLQRMEMEASTEAQEKLADVMDESVIKQAELINATLESVIVQQKAVKAQIATAKAQQVSAAATRELTEATLLSAEMSANASIAATLTEVLAPLIKAAPKPNTPEANTLIELREIRTSCLEQVSARTSELSIKRRTSKSSSTED